MKSLAYIALAASALVLTGCVQSVGDSAAPQSTRMSDADSRAIDKMLAGESQTEGAELEKLLVEADKHPLGSDKNPVRVSGPSGQRAYLSTLRCADGNVPQFYRVGNFGVGAFGNIVDGYDVTCPGSSPEKTMVMMDMYHNGRTESRTIAGFTKVQ
jgi:hypothetical protein